MLFLTGADINKYLKATLCTELPYRSVKKDYDEKKNFNPEICSRCGGRCCKSYGCHFSPDDFKEISFEALKKELEKGYISIDCVANWTISLPGGFILRSRHKGAPIVDIQPPLGNICCILFGEDGCKLKYNERPSGGRLLVPSTTFCHQEYPLQDCIYEWMPHQRIIFQLINYFEDKEIPCSL